LTIFSRESAVTSGKERSEARKKIMVYRIDLLLAQGVQGSMELADGSLHHLMYLIFELLNAKSCFTQRSVYF
jgi:hypothetical protein